MRTLPLPLAAPRSSTLSSLLSALAWVQWEVGKVMPPGSTRRDHGNLLHIVPFFADVPEGLQRRGEGGVANAQVGPKPRGYVHRSEGIRQA